MRLVKKILVTGAMILWFSQAVYAESYEYDALNRVTKVMYEDGSYVTYEYDASGNMISTQVTEPETELETEPETEPEIEPEEESGWENWLENILNSLEKQITEVLENLAQEITELLNNLFGG